MGVVCRKDGRFLILNKDEDSGTRTTLREIGRQVSRPRTNRNSKVEFTGEGSHQRQERFQRVEGRGVS